MEMNNEPNAQYQKCPEPEREGFVRKVFGILALQLVITSFFCIGACSDSGAEFYANNTALLILAIVVVFASLIPLICCGLSRKVPTNYILLLLFTLGEGYLVGAGCSVYEPQSILIAVLMTAALTIGLCLYAVYTKTDYTMMGGMLTVLLLGLIIFGFIAALANVAFLKTLYSALGAILFSIYIVFDVQMVIGRGQDSYSMDDYILGALNIYLDVINLLMYILALFGDKRN